MTIGTKLIDELSRRGMMGQFFTYEQYQRLHRIDSTEALQALLEETMFKDIVVTDDAMAVVDQLNAATAPRNSWCEVLSDVLGDVFLFGLPRLFRLRRRRRGKLPPTPR
jgi:hypothetical protein